MPDSEPNKAEMTELHRAATIFATAAGVKVQHNAPYSVNLILDDGRVLVIPLGTCSPWEEVAAVNGVVALAQAACGIGPAAGRGSHLSTTADALREALSYVEPTSAILCALVTQTRRIEYEDQRRRERPCECGHAAFDHLFRRDGCRQACSCRTFKAVEVNDAPF